MNKNEFFKRVRTGIVGILGCIAFILMVGEPVSEESWFQVMLWTKALAFAIGFVSYRLFTYWEAKGLLPAEFSDEEI